MYQQCVRTLIESEIMRMFEFLRIYDDGNVLILALLNLMGTTTITDNGHWPQFHGCADHWPTGGEMPVALGNNRTLIQLHSSIHFSFSFTKSVLHFRFVYFM